MPGEETLQREEERWIVDSEGQKLLAPAIHGKTVNINRIHLQKVAGSL